MTVNESAAQKSESGAETCTLCTLPVPDPPVTAAAVTGRFCCHGCLEVYRVLGEVDESESTDHIRSRFLSQSESSTQDRDESAAATTYLTVDGMHCSTCELFLEERTGTFPGVASVSASYAADVLRVDHDPSLIDEAGLIDAVSGTGYRAKPREPSGKPADPAPDVTLTRFLIGGGLFGMMVMLWYVMFLYPPYFGYSPLFDLGSTAGLYLFLQIWLLTSVVLFYTGYPLLRGAYVSLRAKQPNMDLLVSIAALSAYVYSTVAMLIGRTDLYFDVTVAIILVVTAGTYYEGRIKERATGLLSDLASMQVSSARRPDGGTVPIDDLKPGDRLLVRPGERLPVDGTIHDGAAAVDEALVTGEPLPRTKRPGDQVRGGTLVVDHPLVIETGDPVTSTIDRLVDLQWSIQSTRHGVQRLADKLSTVFVPLVLVLAVLGFIGTIVLGGSPVAALLVGLTVLIVSCPCALGVATPLAVAAGVKEAASRGIVVASDAFFEATPTIDTVVIDKTGTLTEGEMAVESVFGSDPERILTMAAAVERFSAHPVAEAICRDAGEVPSDLATDGGTVAIDSGPADPEIGVEDYRTFDRGVQGTVDGTTVTVGHPRLFDTLGVEVHEDVRERAAAVNETGSLPILVGVDGVAVGIISIGDRPRTAWESVVESFSEAGYDVVVLTGDDSKAAERFGRSPHVDRVFAGVPPEAKAETIERLRSNGPTAMIGDGSNDAPALAAADIGIALDSGTELAIDAADAIVIEDDLEATVDVFRLARGTNRRIKENLGWALVYNGIAIPLALTGLLNPLFAALAMATSSVLVVINSSRRFS